MKKKIGDVIWELKKKTWKLLKLDKVQINISVLKLNQNFEDCM